MAACKFDVPADLVSLPQRCCSNALSLARTQPVQWAQPVHALESPPLPSRIGIPAQSPQQLLSRLCVLLAASQRSELLERLAFIALCVRDMPLERCNRGPEEGDNFTGFAPFPNFETPVQSCCLPSRDPPV